MAGGPITTVGALQFVPAPFRSAIIMPEYTYMVNSSHFMTFLENAIRVVSLTNAEGIPRLHCRVDHACGEQSTLHRVRAFPSLEEGEDIPAEIPAPTAIVRPFIIVTMRIILDTSAM